MLTRVQKYLDPYTFLSDTCKYSIRTARHYIKHRVHAIVFVSTSLLLAVKCHNIPCCIPINPYG